MDASISSLARLASLAVGLVALNGAGAIAQTPALGVSTTTPSRRSPIKLSMALSETMRLYSISLPPIAAGRVTTALEYRMTPGGPVGSIGLQRSLEQPSADPLQPTYRMGFGPSQPPEVTVGARLSYRFK